MISKGTVCLVYRDEVITAKHYCCPAERKRFIEEWSRLYAKNFYKCYIHVLPNTDLLVSEKGKNKEARGRKRRISYYKMTA